MCLHGSVQCGQFICGVLVCDTMCQGLCASCILDSGTEIDTEDTSRGMCFFGRIIKCVVDATGGRKTEFLPAVSAPYIDECGSN